MYSQDVNIARVFLLTCFQQDGEIAARNVEIYHWFRSRSDKSLLLIRHREDGQERTK